MAARIQRVSVVVPMLDEEARIEGLVADVAAQAYAGELELLVADGGSSDGSADRLRAAAARHRVPLTLIENPRRLIPHGLNACIGRATGDLVVRLDCHARYPRDYLRRCVAAAEESGAWNVGGLTVAVGRSDRERAAACAADSAFGGIGWTRHAAAPRRVEVDTVYCGAFRREVFERVGGFDEALPRNEDEDLNLRIRRAGGRVLLDPRIRAFYTPPGSAAALCRRYHGYGRGKVDLMRKHGRPPTLRSLAPLAFAGSLAALAPAAVWSRRARRALAAELALHGACALACGLRELRRRGEPLRLLPRVAVAFPAMHLGYGAGLLHGLLRPARRPRDAERLGVYVDEVLCAGDGAVSTDCAFLLFAAEVGRRFAATVLFGRAVSGRRGAHALPAETRLVALPYYRDLRAARQVACAAPGTVRALWRGLDGVDVVWAFGPNPFALVLVALAVARRRRVALGIRQDGLAYFRARRAPPALAWALDGAWGALARRLPATVMGADLARAYGPRALGMTAALVPAREIPAVAPPHDWSREILLLAVGRLDVEKDPLLAVDLLAALPGRFRLAWLGRGPLEDAVRARAAALGLADRLELGGYVAFGPALLARYRGAHALVHVARTEGVPQAIVEAQACGTPVVASAVGGVPGALDHGRAGLLVPPGDAHALAASVLRLAGDAALRRRLAERGLALARGRSLEDEARRVADHLGGRG